MAIRASSLNPVSQVCLLPPSPLDGMASRAAEKQVQYHVVASTGMIRHEIDTLPSLNPLWPSAKPTHVDTHTHTLELVPHDRWLRIGALSLNRSCALAMLSREGQPNNVFYCLGARVGGFLQHRADVVVKRRFVFCALLAATASVSLIES